MAPDKLADLKCNNCDNLAVWEYMPTGKNKDDNYLRCNDCVPRDCPCMSNDLYDSMCSAAQYDSLQMPGMIPKFDPAIHAQRDDNGVLLPCCDWMDIGWEDHVVALPKDDEEEKIIRII